jgi:shikimate dehydrogenase
MGSTPGFTLVEASAASRSRTAVIGWPLGHSISPAFQQAAFDALGLPVAYRAVPVAPPDLEAFVASLRRPTDGGSRWLGVNVTIPHKQAIAALMDDATEEARQIGAVNTVICHGDRLIGHNTDATGFLQGMRDVGVEPAGMAAVVLGAGGAARAVAVGLLRSGVTELAIANRSPERAESLCWTLQEAFPKATLKPLPLDAGVLRARLAIATLLVNTTSVGMHGGPDPNGCPVPPDALGARHVVYDLVYNPQITPLLAGAIAAGATIIKGLPMLVHQGAASFARWTGATPPLNVMFAAAREALGEPASLI